MAPYKAEVNKSQFLERQRGREGRRKGGREGGREGERKREQRAERERGMDTCTLLHLNKLGQSLGSTQVCFLSSINCPLGHVQPEASGGQRRCGSEHVLGQLPLFS